MDRRESIKAEVEALPMNMPCDPPFDIDAELRKAYDPVAVLEAMRERYSLVDLCAGRDGSARGQWLATLRVDDKNGPYFFHELPDFTSAVRWLHQQAAEIDPEFAERWPVPE